MPREGMKRALLLVLLLAFAGSLVGAAVAITSPATSPTRLPSLDQRVLAALNETRVKQGLRPLVVSEDLRSAAVAHSRAMLTNGFFAHDSRGGVSFMTRLKGFYRRAGFDTWAVGENLFYSTGATSAEDVIAAWLASPGHKENMLAPSWREAGIGSLHSRAAGGLFGGNSTWVITVDFGARSGKPATTTRVPQSALSPAGEPSSGRP